MRIISDYHDYYDCIMTPGVKEPLWLRNQLLVKYEKKDKWPFPDIAYWSLNNADTVFIGVAGKVERLVLLHHWVRDHWETDWCWDEETAIAAMEAHEKPKWINMWKRRKWGPYREIKRFWEAEIPESLIKEMFERAPIWVAEGRKRHITYNARLAEWNYQKRLPPPQAFQTLAAWVGNIAQPEKPIPKISDEIMLEAKGFDKVTSFRKPKKAKK